MIMLGGQKIAVMYAGAQKIAKAYAGEAKLFGEDAPPSRLPEGYTELEYVENSLPSNYRGLSSGINFPNMSTRWKIDMDVSMAMPSLSADFYVMTGTSNTTGNQTTNSCYVYLHPYPNSNYVQLVIIFGNISASEATLRFPYSSEEVRHHFIFDSLNLKVSIDGNEIDATKSSSPKVNNYMALFKSTRLSTSTSFYYIPAKVHSVKLYKDEELQREYVPAKDESTGKVGFYEMIIGTFVYSNNTSYPFTPGPAV